MGLMSRLAVSLSIGVAVAAAALMASQRAGIHALVETECQGLGFRPGLPVYQDCIAQKAEVFHTRRALRRLRDGDIMVVPATSRD